MIRTSLFSIALFGSLLPGIPACNPTALFAQSPMIVAHRGASYDAPENTLPAFKLAWEQNADAVEGDFYLTKDNRIVCIHDKSTKKYAKRNLVVEDSTYEELRQLDVGSYKGAKFAGTRIPLISEVFSLVPPEKKIYIEIKCGPEIIPFLLEELKSSKLKNEQTVLISFNSEVIRQFKLKKPECKCYWLSSFKRRLGGLSPDSKTVLTTLKNIKADGFSSNYKGLTSKFVQSINDNGYEYHCWTVNDRDKAKSLSSWGVQSITTDRPGWLRQAWQK